ncbi:MAG: GNAT family N-acetyltransferase [Sphingomonas sp.]|nr:GNAT family N-acetyltransferase [Sphingomonas sp.]
MSVTYRLATRADDQALAAVGRLCFAETFGPHFAPDDMALHLDRSFGPGGLPADLDDPACRVWMTEADGEIAGYLKLMPMGLPVDHPTGSLEIRQLYILTPWQGAGIAAALMDWAIGAARERGAPALFLSVWEKGARAIAFYRKHGFEIAGSAPFTLGASVMIDPVMRRDL